MITYKFHYWTGDRDAGVVTDEFILNEEMAHARAVQELCDLYKIVISKTLQTTVDTDLEIGQLKFFSIPRLGIYGNNEIVSITTSLSHEGAYEDLEIETYTDMEIPA